jgi:hypothetical protein
MYKTALSIIQAACAETALPIPASIESSTDTGVIQLVALLNSAGYELANWHNWQQLQKLHSIVTISGQGAYDLPTDLAYYIDQTQWDDSHNNCLIGPASPQEWRKLTSGLIAPISSVFRMFGNKFNILPVPSDGMYITIVYMSNAWVDTNGEGIYTQLVVNNGDIPQYDWMLLVKYLKVKMWQARGLDTTAYQNDFNNYFDTLVAKDLCAPILNLTRASYNDYLLGISNIPFTGYGL